MEVLYVCQFDFRGHLMNVSMYPVLPFFAHRAKRAQGVRLALCQDGKLNILRLSFLFLLSGNFPVTGVKLIDIVALRQFPCASQRLAHPSQHRFILNLHISGTAEPCRFWKV